MNHNTGSSGEPAGAAAHQARSICGRSHDDRDAHPVARDASSAGFAVHLPVRGPDGAIVDFEYTYINAAGARLLGATAAEIVGRRVTAVEPQALAAAKLSVYARVAETGEPHERSLQYRDERTGGSDTVVQLSVVRVGTAVAATFCDDTWRTRAHAESVGLRADYDRAALHAARILERMSDAHVTLDRAFRILTVNAAGVRSLDRPRERLLGHRYWDVAPVPVDSEAGQLYRRVVADGCEGHATHHVADAGEGHDLEIEAYPTDDGGVAIFWRDVSARVAAEVFQQEFTARLGSWNKQLQANGVERDQLLAAAEHARVEAEEANRTKTEFLTTMSHELRTPLNAIGGYAELMELEIHGPITDAQREDLSRIQRSQRHLLGLINAVLNHARLKAGAVTFEVKHVNVADAASNAATMLGPQLKLKGVTLDVRACSEDTVARVDSEKLRQILVNLLTNAVKFTNAGGVIAVQCAVDGDHVAIAVSDTGIGIPEQHLLRIFEPFVQVDAGLARLQGGLGLGLAISRDLARGMDGDLTVHSEVGVGSTFTLRLPRGLAASDSASAARTT